MEINDYLDFKKNTAKVLLKIHDDYQKILQIIDKNKTLKNKIKKSTENKQENSKTPPKLYLNPKTNQLIIKCVKILKQIDPISGWFVHLLTISGCRGAELQKVKMQDISSFLSTTGKTLYNIKVNVVKKRINTCVREFVINSKEFNSIQKVHEDYFKEKILIQTALIFFKKPSIDLKIIELALTILLKNLKSCLKNQDLKQINLFICVEICLFLI